MNEMISTYRKLCLTIQFRILWPHIILWRHKEEMEQTAHVLSCAICSQKVSRFLVAKPAILHYH